MGAIFKEFTQTKERTVAWAFRILITLLGAVASALFYVAWGVLIDIKTTQAENIKSVWQEMSTISKNEGDTSKLLGELTTTVTDHMRDDTNTDGDIKSWQEKEDDRVRTLEQNQHH